MVLRHVTEVRRTTRRKLWRLVASGVLLAVQWSAYSWAVAHTSLAHTLLFLSATPVLLAGWHWVSRQPISAGGSRAWQSQRISKSDVCMMSCNPS